MPSFRQPERRRHRRVRMKQGLRICASNPKDPQFEEISTTKDVSQDGIYFVDVYAEGMRVYVTVPYHSPSSPQNYHYLGQVTRLDALGNNQKGVAINFLSSADKKSPQN
jgi:hypothetical protein